MTNKKVAIYIVSLGVFAVGASIVSLLSGVNLLAILVGFLLLYTTVLNDFHYKTFSIEIENLKEEIKYKDDLIDIQEEYIKVVQREYIEIKKNILKIPLNEIDNIDDD